MLTDVEFQKLVESISGEFKILPREGMNDLFRRVKLNNLVLLVHRFDDNYEGIVAKLKAMIPKESNE